MKVQQVQLMPGDDWSKLDGLGDADLVLAFGGPKWGNDALFYALCMRFPGSILAGCSTAGEMTSEGVSVDSCVVTVIKFDNVELKSAYTILADMEASYSAGEILGRSLGDKDLSGILIFAPGVQVNGSALVSGLESLLPPGLPVMGGLAGDNGAFASTWVLCDEGVFNNRIVAIGLPKQVHFAHGTFGGWKAFGPVRKVTRVEGNVLFELDGEKALDVYKRYLGDYAKDLPGSGLLFPFEWVASSEDSTGIVRTILGIDEETGALILAGDVPEEGLLRLMHANTDSLVQGAEKAASQLLSSHRVSSQGMLLMVSCVGRKLVMGGRVDEEVEVVMDAFEGIQAVAGFYSNGEISPLAQGGCCLHNQTMTITWIGQD